MGENNVICDFTADIYDETVQKLSKLKLDTECVGGGRIQHTPESKFIKVYGYSQVCIGMFYFFNKSILLN